MIGRVVSGYASVLCILSFVVRCCRGLPNSLGNGKFSIFFDFFVKLDVGVLFVKVVVESVGFVFVNLNRRLVCDTPNSLLVFSEEQLRR